ncbi:MAG: preprotein translocase subunit SecE [Clostridiales bacterium]|nr:preprotein translocase subunit SecE [Clostridiales bacterium]
MEKNKKNPKEKGKFKKKAKETISEIKKVTWPTFGEVCKRTGVVLVVVLVFALVIFGIDYGLGALVGLLRG